MLFLAVLLAGTQVDAWKKILALITAFTIGHSITLAITVLFSPLLTSDIVEFLIPLTIIATALINLIGKKDHFALTAALTVVFGLIHGMGFAGYLAALLPNGDLWLPLLAFNLGVEAGQIIFALGLIIVLLTTRYTSKRAVRVAQTGLSIVGLVISLILAADNWIF